jgi:hypothetical protein
MGQQVIELEAVDAGATKLIATAIVTAQAAGRQRAAAMTNASTASALTRAGGAPRAAADPAGRPEDGDP